MRSADTVGMRVKRTPSVPPVCAARYDLARGGDDISYAGQLELQAHEAGWGAGTADGVNPHAGSADVRSPAKVGVAVEELVHEHVDFAPGISSAIMAARLLTRINTSMYAYSYM